MIPPLVWAVVLIAALGLSPGNAAAQTPAELEIGVTVAGRIEPGASLSWSFLARDGAVLSFLVEATSGTLDPVMTLQTSSGALLIGNDDVRYPHDRNALLEAITMPRTDTYTITVSGFDETAGDFNLGMLQGYAQILHIEDFDSETGWQTPDDLLSVEANEGQLRLELEGVQVIGVASSTRTFPRDYYVGVKLTNVSGRGGWLVGLALRQQTADRYYLLAVNNQGMWRFTLRTPDEDRIVRDWATHPAIIPDESDFSLGVLANDTAFDIFYNGQFIGQVTDETLNAAGGIGLVAGTANVIEGQVTAAIDQLIITVPLEQDDTGIFPQHLTSGTGNNIVHQLERRRVIPTGGEMALVVAESFAQGISPGVIRFTLAKGSTFSNFVLGTTVTLQSQADATAGCGILFRSVDDTRYTLAFLDQTGAYGLSRREGDHFQPGIFGFNPELGSGPHQMLVVANEGTVYYYIDGHYVGAQPDSPVAGEVGNAVVNYDPVDTSCQFTDTWLWQWE